MERAQKEEALSEKQKRNKKGQSMSRTEKVA